MIKSLVAALFIAKSDGFHFRLHICFVVSSVKYIFCLLKENGTKNYLLICDETLDVDSIASLSIEQ